MIGEKKIQSKNKELMHIAYMVFLYFNTAANEVAEVLWYQASVRLFLCHLDI